MIYITNIDISSMKAEDLMIGDWVLVEGKPLRVTNISVLGGDIIRVMNPFMSYDIAYASNIVALSKGAQDINKIEPIPLTPEILEKNGFTKDSGGEELYSIDSVSIIDVGYGFELFISNNDDEKGEFDGTKKYVHELQHALKLCEIDKDIVL